MPADKRDEDSIGSSVYQGLVQLTFLCGRGIPTSDLMQRFLHAVRPQIPADGLWLFENGRLLASDHAGGLVAPGTPQYVGHLGDIVPRLDAAGFLIAPVLPGLILVVKPIGENPTRSSDVVMLMARIIGLAWYSETRGDPLCDLDDYHAAKHLFKKRWLKSLLVRHGGVTAAARASGLSRAAIYQLMEQFGVEHPRRTATHVRTAADTVAPQNGEAEPDQPKATEHPALERNPPL